MIEVSVSAAPALTLSGAIIPAAAAPAGAETSQIVDFSALLSSSTSVGNIPATATIPAAPGSTSDIAQPALHIARAGNPASAGSATGKILPPGKLPIVAAPGAHSAEPAPDLAEPGCDDAAERRVNVPADHIADSTGDREPAASQGPAAQPLPVMPMAFAIAVPLPATPAPNQSAQNTLLQTVTSQEHRTALPALANAAITGTDARPAATPPLVINTPTLMAQPVPGASVTMAVPGTMAMPTGDATRPEVAAQVVSSASAALQTVAPVAPAPLRPASIMQVPSANLVPAGAGLPPAAILPSSAGGVLAMVQQAETGIAAATLIATQAPVTPPSVPAPMVPPPAMEAGTASAGAPQLAGAPIVTPLKRGAGAADLPAPAVIAATDAPEHKSLQFSTTTADLPAFTAPAQLVSGPVALEQRGVTAAQTAPVIATSTPAMPDQQPQDIAALVDRITQARAAAAPEGIRAAVMHQDFGSVALNFRSEGSHIHVALSSADPGFAPAVHAAAAASLLGSGTGESDRRDTPPPSHQPQTFAQDTSASNNPSAQQQTPRERAPAGERVAAREQGTSRQPSSANERASAESTSQRRNGIYA